MSRVSSLCWWKSNSTNNRKYKTSFILEGPIFYSVRYLKYTSFQTNHLIRYYSSKKAIAGSTTLSKINKEKIPSLTHVQFPSLSHEVDREIEKKNTIKMNENYPQLDPMWITGFFDGEGCFYINISIKSSNKKYYVSPHIYLGLHKKDITILKLIIKNLGVGRINYKHGSTSVQLDVGSLHEIETLIAFFDKYSLVSKKKADFHLFKEIINIIKMKEHLTDEGLEKIVALKASMNLGLSQKLKVAFSYVVPINRPIVKIPDNFNPFWLAGFASPPPPSYENPNQLEGGGGESRYSF